MEVTLTQCTLRSWRANDAEQLAVIANDPSIASMMRDRFPHPYTLADAQAFIALASDEHQERSVAIVVDGAVAGGIGCIQGTDIHRVSGEVGYWLGAASRGRGIAAEALRGFVAWIWDNTELQYLHASAFTTNPASVRVLEKAGFTRTHLAPRSAIKQGLLMDEWHFQLTNPAP